MRCLIYALGGGLGHLTRSIALARAAARRGMRSTILSNSPFAERLPVGRELSEHDSLITVPPDFDRDTAAEYVAAVLERVPFDILVVDTFPRGLGGELAELLPQLGVPKVLVHRDLNERYVTSYQLANYALIYDRLLMPGERGPLDSHPAATRTARWLIRDADELLPCDIARQELLGFTPDESPIVLVSASGRVEEIAEMKRLADWLAGQLVGQAHICFSSPSRGHEEQIKWPLLRLMAGVDILIGAGGYNTVSEARATCTPLLAFARKRQYDRQRLRLSDEECVTNRAELLASISPLLCTSPPSGSHVNYLNGVHQAVDVMMELL